MGNHFCNTTHILPAFYKPPGYQTDNIPIHKKDIPCLNETDKTKFPCSVVAKNYLNEKQIRQPERAVTGYFDYIEDLIDRENVFTMEEFSKSVNEFRRYDILKDNGRISHKQAVEKAYQECDIFNKTQQIESDFDKVVKRLSKASIDD